ncbi:MAG: type II toxin-antitoxin system RelE/ParE family toxin [Deltaproteobacteria bacterium]|nr:type II toxin-antitoxin system RelE/ParE family toxin [Deltaproteobacteria bacterium]
MIQSFACKETKKVFNREYSRKFPSDIHRRAMRKLWVLHAVKELKELRIPPANRLEALQGEREGQHSIRINDQWRICFRWDRGNAHDVEIIDYH